MAGDSRNAVGSQDERDGPARARTPADHRQRSTDEQEPLPITRSRLAKFSKIATSSGRRVLCAMNGGLSGLGESKPTASNPFSMISSHASFVRSGYSNQSGVRLFAV